MGESGLTPNENCCVCKSKLVSSTSAAVTTSPTIPTIPEAAIEVEGFSYGYGWCKDCNDVVLSKVIKNYVYSSDECALFCEPFKAESSYRGYTWTDGPGNEDHCYCMVDSDSDLSSLSSKYGGDRIEQNAGSGPIGYSNLALGKTYDAYCYAETRDTCPSATSPPTTDETAIQETLENSEANTIEIKLKPYADLDWRNKILFEPYVPSPIVSASCSNKCPCSFTPYDEGVCQCGIEMACGGTIPIDLASGNELKFVWEASSDNDKYISVTGTSQTRVEIRLTIQDCTAPYQLIHGSNVTIVIDGLDGIEQKFTYDPESSFVDLGSCDGCGDICDVFTRMVFNPNENGVLDMKFTTLTFTAGYDNRKVTDETSYTWATDSYTWIWQPEGGSIKLLDMLAGYSTPTPVPVGGAPSNAIYYESFEDGVLPDLWSTSFSYAPLFRRELQEEFRFAWTISSESPQTGVYSVKNPEVSFGSGGFLGEYKLTLTTPQEWGAGLLYFSIFSYIEFSSVEFTEDLIWLMTSMKVE